MNKIATMLLVTFLLAVFPAQAFAAKVVVDAGHGGSDPGAIGVNQLREKDVNLDIAMKLKQQLVERGYEVTLTRSGDSYLSLSSRVDFTNEANADLFVSIHANSHTSSSARGSLVLYYDNAYPQADYPASPEMAALTPKSKKLATSVLNGVVKSAGTINLGIVPSAVYVVRSGKIPSILVETAFLSNAQDAAMLSQQSVRQNMAVGIANGIAAYLPAVFSDIRPDYWAFDSIARLKEMDIVHGDNGKFAPERSITRAEFAAMMTRVVPLPQTTQDANASNATSEGKGNFPDLSQAHWAYGALQQAIRLGVMQGYPDGTIHPDSAISRAEIAVMLDRAVRIANGTSSGEESPDEGTASDNNDNAGAAKEQEASDNGASSDAEGKANEASPGPVKTAAASPQQETGSAYEAIFDDVPEQFWAAASVYKWNKLGIIKGTEANVFEPNRSAKRAETAVMLDRYIQQAGQ